MSHARNEGESGTKPLTRREAASLRAWIGADTEAAVVRQLGLSRLAVARLAAALPVHATTRLAVRAALARRAA